MDDVLSRIEYEVGGKNKNRTNNGDILTLDNVIVSSACIKGTKKSFYKIEGFGGCNGCSEYTAYYSLQGELLYEDYVSSSKNLKYSKGNYQEILKVYGITDTSKISKKARGIQVYPPQYSGDTVEISIR